MSDITEQFRMAMAEAGLRYDGPILADTDKVQRFTVDGDRKKSLNGWYVLYSDGVPAGEFGCWKRNVSATWCAKRGSDMTQAEREAANKRIDDARERRRQYELARQAEAAESAAITWEAAEPATDHPYLQRKHVQSYGLRVGRWTRVDQETGEIWMAVDNALLVPVRDGKKLVSLQAIFPNSDNALGRDKDFLPGGKKRGCFYAIGKPANSNEPTVVICEGYATAASIHEATGHPVVMAFDAGNLVPVAERIRANYPKGKIIIAADNDRWTTSPIDNPGVHYARLAAQSCGGHVVVPEFKDINTKPTDFNDLHALEGMDAVRMQIEPKPASTPAPANDNAPAVFDPAAIDWYAPFPDVNGKGKPKATIENVAEATRRLGVTIRYNVIKKDVEILIPGARFTIDNQANASLAWLASNCTRFDIPTGPLGEYVNYLADLNLHNPVANWVTCKPWDGVSRMQAFYQTITAEGEDEDLRVLEQKVAMMRRWMISAIAAAFRPNGVSAHGVLVLQGDQYLGKTKWFKSLVPSDLGVIQDGLMLRPDDRDSVKQVVSYWLVELGELDATFRKSDIAQLKSFLTRDRDVLRRAYARMESEYARRTVFFASVNPRQFLHDPTGNRRYWTISCKKINHDHRLDMQQVWAEVYQQDYLRGETWYLTPDEMQALNDNNRDHEVLDPIRERLQSRFDWEAPASMWRWMTATDAMAEIGFDRPTRADVTQAGQILQELNGQQRRKSNGRLLAKVPPKNH